MQTSILELFQPNITEGFMNSSAALNNVLLFTILLTLPVIVWGIRQALYGRLSLFMAVITIILTLFASCVLLYYMRTVFGLPYLIIGLIVFWSFTGSMWLIFIYIDEKKKQKIKDENFLKATTGKR